MYKKHSRQKVTYSQEKFVRGFDLTCGEFYRLREWLVPLLIEGQLYKQDLGKHDVKWDLCKFHEETCKHSTLASKTMVPLYWTQKMV
jgi:hypothetical protein